MQETEMRNPATTHIDRADTADMLKLLQAENRRAVDAVGEVLPAIARAVDLAAQSLHEGGRIFYAGAGTSGRLGVLDAAECVPTFGVAPGTVVGLLAGGDRCMTSASEDAEDNEDAGRRDLLRAGACGRDLVIAISASGNAAYAAGALLQARQAGARTVALTCNEDARLNALCDVAVVTRTGAEAITGSTRLKAGTAQKMVLNMISTAAMVKTGKVYENLMINVRPVNQKLRGRCIRIIMELTGKDADRAERALDAAGGDIRSAVAALRGGAAH